MVHPVGVVRRPAGVGFHADHLQIRVALEDAAEDEQADDVLAAADDRLEAVEHGTARRPAARFAGQDVEADRKVHLDRRLPQGIEDRAVVVFLGRRLAGHHHALEPHVLDPPEVGDRLGDRPDGRLAESEQAVGRRANIVLEPTVVGPHAGVLVVGVVDAADQHADGGIDQFAGEPVTVLVGQPRLGVPPAAMQRGEPVALRLDVLGPLARGGQGVEADPAGDTLDLIFFTAGRWILDDDRSAIAKRGVDVVDVAVGRLDDM